MQAISANQPEVARLLLDRGASPDYAPKGSYSPLAAAAYDNNKEAVEFLLAHGANPNKGGRVNEPPLLDNSATSANIVILQDLINAGADIHAADARGDNALILATKSYHADAVEFLAKAGLDPCARDRSGKSALDFLQDTGIEWENVNLPPADWEIQQKKARQQMIQFLQSRCSSK